MGTSVIGSIKHVEQSVSAWSIQAQFVKAFFKIVKSIRILSVFLVDARESPLASQTRTNKKKYYHINQNFYNLKAPMQHISSPVYIYTSLDYGSVYKNIDMSSGCFIYGVEHGRSQWTDMWAGCQIVVDPVYLWLPPCLQYVWVWCYMDASNKPTYICVYCLRECAIWSIPGADGETQRSMSCDHEVEAAYDH